jgi:hypothetical protein
LVNLIINIGDDSNWDLEIAEDTFRELQNLDHLNIRAKKGKWMRYLTNLRSLNLFDLGSDDNDVNYFDYLTNLEELSIQRYYSSSYKDSHEELKQLKCLRLRLKSYTMLKLQCHQDFLNFQVYFSHTIFLDAFKHLRNLTKLSITGQIEIIDADILNNFSKLTHLELNIIEKFEMKILELENLETLRIGFCDLFPTLPDNVFTKLTKLQNLQIGAMSFNTLSNANIFNGLENVVDFSLWIVNHPYKFNFDMNFLSKMSKLESLYLSENLRNSLHYLVFIF